VGLLKHKRAARSLSAGLLYDLQGEENAVVLTVSAEQGFTNSRRVKLPNGGEFVRSVFIGTQDKPANPDPRQPQFYTVEQMPETVVDPHYHVVEQWQVIVQGEGTLGRHAAKPVAVHYVDRYTGYGPIIAGKQGLTYYTVRAMSDPGAQFLDKPQAKEKLKQGLRSKKRYLYVEAEEVRASTRDELRRRSKVDTDPVVPAYDDGLAAWMVRMGPSAEALAPDPAQCGGQGLLVISGNLVHEHKELTELSCIFVATSSAPMRLKAGSSGAEILVLQFPRTF
jgi:hypothetical protein